MQHWPQFLALPLTNHNQSRIDERYQVARDSNDMTRDSRHWPHRRPLLQVPLPSGTVKFNHLQDTDMDMPLVLDMPRVRSSQPVTGSASHVADRNTSLASPIPWPSHCNRNRKSAPILGVSLQHTAHPWSWCICPCINPNRHVKECPGPLKIIVVSDGKTLDDIPLPLLESLED
ncbi:hypothetical protein CKAH01_12583 [Colletotrichum kahawae]|uniref:Uncharacterized protein n=1 Tax=Colletotrichum kahawae TaxID=34407 RepID=A0AAD9YUZ3_COLKA|nr:hypothetical protein CKAH01_12583 [Colletotrichum kahawae]